MCGGRTGSAPAAAAAARPAPRAAGPPSRPISPPGQPAVLARRARQRPGRQVRGHGTGIQAQQHGRQVFPVVSVMNPASPAPASPGQGAPTSPSPGHRLPSDFDWRSCPHPHYWRLLSSRSHVKSRLLIARRLRDRAMTATERKQDTGHHSWFPGDYRHQVRWLRPSG